MYKGFEKSNQFKLGEGISWKPIVESWSIHRISAKGCLLRGPKKSPLAVSSGRKPRVWFDFGLHFLSSIFGLNSNGLNL